MITSRNGIRAKLFACFGLLTLASAGASLYSLITVGELRTRLKSEIQGSATRADQGRRITIGLANMRLAYRGMSLFGVQKIPEQFEKARNGFLAASEDMQQTLREMKATGLSSEERKSVGEIEDGLKTWLEQFPRFVGLSREGHAVEASQMTLKTISPIMDMIQKTAADFGRVNFDRQRAASAAVGTSLGHSQTLMVGLLIAVLGVCTGGFIIATSLVKSLVRIEKSVATGAEQVALAAVQLSSSSQAMAQGASKQAAAITETSASTEEISTMARRNAGNSQTAATIVSQAQKGFSDTNQALDQMVVAMAEINSSSEQISTIIKVIDGIAFQTNILALNAAVEAARAGEAGMGFAVVADEVRNLAQRCAQAARDTAALIEQSVEKSRGGKLKVDEVALAIRELGAGADKVRVLVDEVRVGSDEQARGLEQIGKSITQIEQVTQSTASSSKDAASSAVELNRQSNVLNDVVNQLSVLVYGGTAIARANRRPTGSRPTHHAPIELE
jgi:methyl-accepting chemotaxis protein/methyl-accepting chemotaxis protein-1 (serine sensor receptor)